MAQGEWKGTTDLIEAAITILREQQPCIIRQLFYLMIGVGPLVNDPASYRKVSRIIVKARRDRRVPYEWICDRTRPVYEPNVWKSPQEYGEEIKRSYRRDYWQWQRVHVEIWSEKDTAVGSIEDLAAQLGVTIRVCRGFNSETRVHQIARILAASGKPNVVLFLGDHDASGIDIERDLQDRVLAQGSGPFELRRVAILQRDIAQFNLPPQRVKDSDPRSGRFKARHGTECVELDALPPMELRRRLGEEIKRMLDLTEWQRAINVERVEIESIIETVSRWPSVKEERNP